MGLLCDIVAVSHLWLETGMHRTGFPVTAFWRDAPEMIFSQKKKEKILTVNSGVKGRKRWTIGHALRYIYAVLTERRHSVATIAYIGLT